MKEMSKNRLDTIIMSLRVSNDNLEVIDYQTVILKLNSINLSSFVRIFTKMELIEHIEEYLSKVFKENKKYSNPLNKVIGLDQESYIMMNLYFDSQTNIPNIRAMARYIVDRGIESNVLYSWYEIIAGDYYIFMRHDNFKLLATTYTTYKDKTILDLLEIKVIETPNRRYKVIDKNDTNICYYRSIYKDAAEYIAKFLDKEDNKIYNKPTVEKTFRYKGSYFITINHQTNMMYLYKRELDYIYMLASINRVYSKDIIKLLYGIEEETI